MFSSVEWIRKTLRDCRAIYVSQRLYRKEYVFNWLIIHWKRLRNVWKTVKTQEEKVIWQKLLQKAIHVPKKAINFEFFLSTKFFQILLVRKATDQGLTQKSIWLKFTPSCLFSRLLTFSREVTEFWAKHSKKWVQFPWQIHEPDIKIRPTQNASSHLIHQVCFCLSKKSILVSTVK